jgi:protein-L-isoaspartate(D-aspartate) O-methyltransferase
MPSAATPDGALIARTNMIECQLRPNRVYNEAVLEAMLDLPRELFVPAHLKNVAYTDEALKISATRYLTEPLVTARMFEAAEIEPGHKVMIVGSGSGYSAVLSAMIGAETVGVEEDQGLLDIAQLAARSLNLQNLSWRAGSLVEGNIGGAPYDRIVIDGAIAVLPDALSAQLNEKGRLVTVLKEPYSASHITVFEKVAGAMSRRMTFDNVAHILPGFATRPVFEFS